MSDGSARATQVRPERSLLRTVLRWALRILIALLLLVLLAAACGAIYQVVATGRDAARFPPPGQMVDVGGRRLHLVCSGQGEPTVVLDGPAGTSHLVWLRVQPALAEFTRVCSYDRAGYGWSDPGPASRTSETMAADLYALLRRAGVPGPYVLVGNSMGGMNARLFALRHPDDVAGMVLAESGHEEMFRRLPPSAGVSAEERRLVSALRVAVRVGLLRAAGIVVGEGSSDALPDSLRPAARAAGLRTAWVDAVAAEVGQIEQSNASAAAALAGGPHPLLGDKPLVVLVRDRNDQQFRDDPAVRETWMALQRELAASSTGGVLRVVEGSGHFVEVDRPQAVIEAVRGVVDQVRSAAAGAAAPSTGGAATRR